MHKTSVTDCVVIRSRDRDVKSASTSNFRVTFGRPLTGTYMLVYALIPANAYPVTTANNTVYFRENSTDKSCTLTPGNYTGGTLASAITAAMNTASGGFATFTVTFTASTSKLTIASTQSFVLQFGTYTTNSAAEVLGFAASDTASGTSVTGDYIINLATPISLSIHLSPGSPVSPFITSSMVPTGLVVPINTDFSVYSSLSAQEFPQLIEFASPTKSIQVRVTDSGGNDVDLNGAQIECYLRKFGSSPEVARYPC